MAADQMRAGAAHAVTLRRLLQRADQRGMSGQTQIVVAAEGQAGLTVQQHVRALRCLQGTPAAIEMLTPALSSCAASQASRDAACRSAITSDRRFSRRQRLRLQPQAREQLPVVILLGLSVVSRRSP